jgi:hypothetical protein
LRHHAAYMGEDDAKLIARVAGGDLGQPLEELYDRSAARLHGLGLRLLGDPGRDDGRFSAGHRERDRFGPFASAAMSVG